MSECNPDGIVTDYLGDTAANAIAVYIQIFVVALSWWIVPIAKTLICSSKENEQPLLNKIAWQCILATVPGATGLYAIRFSDSYDDRIQLFFEGVHLRPSEPSKKAKVSTFTVIWNLCVAPITIYPSFSLLLRWASCTPDQRDVLTGQFSYYPTLPGALIRIWIIFDGRLLHRSKNWSIGICAIGLLITAIVVTTATMHVASGNIKSFTFFPIIAFVLTCIPIYDGCWFMFACFYAFMARNIALTYGLGSKTPMLPQHLDNNGFKVVILIIGVICACFACWGVYFMPGGMKADRKARKHTNYDGSNFRVLGVKQDMERRTAEENALFNSIHLAETSTESSGTPKKEPVITVEEV